MNPYLRLDAVELWHIAGWTMVHFLWLGALVGIGAAALRLVLHRTSPNARYIAAATGLAILTALPLVVAGWLMQDRKTNGRLESSIAARGTVARFTPVDLLNSLANERLNNDTAARSQTAPAAPGSAGGLTEGPPSGGQPSELRTPQFTSTANWLESCIVYLPWIWFVGTPLTLALLATGIVGTGRLRRASQPIAAGPITETCARLVNALRVGRRVAIAVCDRVCAPVLVGILRPMILLPPAALTGWSPDEIEMVLLHELAHVRRWDNLVNLLQRLVESLLFFHPAVWLVSGWMRRDREACCDAVVVRHTNKRRAYAELLVSLASQHREPGRLRSRLLPTRLRTGEQRPGSLASAMAAGPLRNRIRYILQLEDDAMLVTGKSFALVLAGLLTAATLAVLYLPARGQAQESTAEVPADNETDDEKAESSDDAEEQSPHELQIDSPNAEAGISDDSDGANAQTESSDQEQEPEPAAHSDSDKSAGAGERRVLGTFSMNPYEPGNLFHAIDEARSKGLYVDLVAKEGNWDLVVAPQPTEADWPAMLGDPPRKERVIADKAWEQLGLKVVPASMLESMDFETRGSAGPIKILGGNVPKGLPLPAFIRRIGDHSLTSFDGLHAWLNEREGRRPTPVSVYAFADGHEYLFDAEPPGETAEGTWPNGIAFSSPEDGEIAMRAWKELGIKTAPLGSEELKFARAHGYRNGLKLVDFAGFPQFNGPFILTEFSSKSISRALDGFADLQAIVDAFSSAPADEIAILKGVHRGGKFEYSMRRPQEKSAVAGGPQSRFPTLEEQKLADLAYRRLQLELEPLDGEESPRVKASGYDGGVWIAQAAGTAEGRFLAGDILVGLHVWPTTSLNDVAELLNREDLAELVPLKFYVIRRPPNSEKDVIVTGRISVNLEPRRQEGDEAGTYAPARARSTWTTPGRDATIGDKNAIQQLDGTVSAVQRKDGATLIEFSIGADDGLREGMTVGVYRGDKYLASVEVLAISPNRAVGRVDKHFDQGPISEGDRVSVGIAQGTAKPQSASETRGNNLVAASESEIKVLQDHIKTLHSQFERLDALFKTGARGGTPDNRALAAYELAAAKGELALAQGQHAEAIERFNEAQSHAQDAFNAFTAAYNVGNATYDVVVTAAKNLANVKRKIIQLQSERPDSNRAASAANAAALDTTYPFAATSQPAAAPRSSESITVLKKIVEREKRKYDRMAELVQEGKATTAEAETQKADYEISLHRLRQAERALEYHRAQVAMAAAEYEAALDASKKAPGAVSELELRKLQLKIQAAEAMYKALAE